MNCQWIRIWREVVAYLKCPIIHLDGQGILEQAHSRYIGCDRKPEPP
jgi:hypothetical protein